MGRKTQVTKEMILEAAYKLLDESGLGAVGIKSIAASLGCSTQPVSWQFGSMTDLKKELMMYAGARLFGPMEEAMKGKNAIEAFFISGKIYLSGACDHPHVFKFLCVDDPMETIGEDPYEGRSIFEFQFDEHAFKLLRYPDRLSHERKSGMDRRRCGFCTDRNISRRLLQRIQKMAR